MAIREWSLPVLSTLISAVTSQNNQLEVNAALPSLQWACHLLFGKVGFAFASKPCVI